MLSITHPYIYSPKEEASYMTELQRRYPVPTPPPSSASPIELAPILDMCDSAVDNRPPSPDSPRLKKFSSLSSDGHFEPHLSHLTQPPPFLEPMPVLQSPQSQTGFFSLELFKVFKNKAIIPKLQIPIPRRSRPVNTPYKNTSKDSIPPLSSSSSSSSSSSITYDENDTMIPTPMSPIMAAASASAASAAAHRHPGSQVAKSLLKSIQPSAISPSLKRSFGMLEDDDNFSTSSDDHDFHPSDIYKKANVDQSMFLTKNAHIKRPRNAWIHFRCHYGQALKSQDPTLRAEEISKRASRRWSKLTENEKKPWHGLAEQEKLAHREAFPEYRYCPRRANSSSSPPSTPVPHAAPSGNGRPRSVSDAHTPLHMHDVFHRNNQKRVKRCSK